jgi:hypothetical protein
MRTAVVLYGFFRTFDFCKVSLMEHIIKPLNADVFFNSPSRFFINEQDEIPEWRSWYCQNEKHIDDGVIDFFGNNLKSGITRKYDAQLYKDLVSKYGFSFGTGVPNVSLQPHYRILSSMHSMQLAILSFIDYVNHTNTIYDLIIFTRPDLKHYTNIDIQSIDFDKINYQSYYLLPSYPLTPSASNPFSHLSTEDRASHMHRRDNGNVSGLNYLMMAAAPQTMKVFSTVYDNVIEYVKNGITFNPYNLLTHHLDANHIKTQPVALNAHETWRFEKDLLDGTEPKNIW